MTQWWMCRSHNRPLLFWITMNYSMTMLMGYLPRCSVHNGRRMLAGLRRMTSAASESDSFAFENTASKPRQPFFPIYYNDVYEFPLPPNHRFPMDKYGKVRKLVQQWLDDLPLDQQGKVRYEFLVSPLATIDELETTHCKDYIQRFMTENCGTYMKSKNQIS